MSLVCGLEKTVMSSALSNQFLYHLKFLHCNNHFSRKCIITQHTKTAYESK